MSTPSTDLPVFEVYDIVETPLSFDRQPRAEHMYLTYLVYGIKARQLHHAYQEYVLIPISRKQLSFGTWGCTTETVDGRSVVKPLGKYAVKIGSLNEASALPKEARDHLRQVILLRLNQSCERVAAETALMEKWQNNLAKVEGRWNAASQSERNLTLGEL